MEKCILAFFAGKQRPLHYSIATMFKVNEKFGSAEGALNELMKDDNEGFEVMRFLAVLMANDAELCRRAEGYDPIPMLTVDDVTTRMTPGEYVGLKNAISKAIGLGYRRENEEENDEVDLGLLELKKNSEAGA